MAIDTSGTWWVGSEPGDVLDYLRAYSAESYPVSDVRLATCTCGGDRFELKHADDEGGAKRTCVACGANRFLVDSEENARGARLRTLRCVACRSREHNVGVGFSLYENGRAIRWIYVGARCVGCGVLGCCAEWKVGYEPSLHLLDHV